MGVHEKTPADVILTLTVTERYTSGSTIAENKVSSTATVHLNNSPKELAELSLRFLGDFATSSVSPEKCVSEFSDTCSGKKDEFNDYSIKVVGKKVTIKVNGVTSVDEEFEKMPDEGILAFQLHTPGPMEVTFKDIVFKELK